MPVCTRATSQRTKRAEARQSKKFFAPEPSMPLVPIFLPPKRHADVASLCEMNAEVQDVYPIQYIFGLQMDTILMVSRRVLMDKSSIPLLREHIAAFDHHATRARQCEYLERNTIAIASSFDEDRNCCTAISIMCAHLDNLRTPEYEMQDLVAGYLHTTYDLLAPIRDSLERILERRCMQYAKTRRELESAFFHLGIMRDIVARLDDADCEATTEDECGCPFGYPHSPYSENDDDSETTQPDVRA